MDVRQFLLDAPETCFFTCYDLLLHAKDGAVNHLEDYNEISEVADITAGDCSLEMVAGNFPSLIIGNLRNLASNYFLGHEKSQSWWCSWNTCTVYRITTLSLPKDFFSLHDIFLIVI